MSVLRVIRFVAAAAMLCVVVTGALGYGEEVKLFGAGAGAITALIAWKLAHIVV